MTEEETKALYREIQRAIPAEAPRNIEVAFELLESKDKSVRKDAAKFIRRILARMEQQLIPTGQL
jgi:hypothetical protein